jgi:hypothetical protein
MNDKTFAELYCARRGIAMQDYSKYLFKDALYPHAHLFSALVQILSPRHFVADHEFINGVSRLRRYREFFYETEEFAHHPDNRGFWRVTANVRISSSRMRHIVRTTLYPSLKEADHEKQTAVPFGGVRRHESKKSKSDNRSVVGP